jgi:hypothetical protein
MLLNSLSDINFPRNLGSISIFFPSLVSLYVCIPNYLIDNVTIIFFYVWVEGLLSCTTEYALRAGWLLILFDIVINSYYYYCCMFAC